MIKNIIFDIGNVLVDFRWRELMTNLGFTNDVIEKLGKDMLMTPLWSQLDRGIMTDEEIIQGFKQNNIGLEEYIDTFLSHKEEIIKPFAYVCSWLENLKSQGYHLYYLSNYPRTFWACHEKHKFTFLPYMEGGIVSAHVQLIKPDHAIYTKLLHTYNLNANECIFIDDTPKNIVAAEELGIYGIIFKNYEDAAHQLQQLLTLHNQFS